jgi:hypothetical protein
MQNMAPTGIGNTVMSPVWSCLWRRCRTNFWLSEGIGFSSVSPEKCNLNTDQFSVALQVAEVNRKSPAKFPKMPDQYVVFPRDYRRLFLGKI